MFRPEVALRFRDPSGEQLTIGITTDPGLVRAVGAELVAEAEDTARGVAGTDPVLGRLCAAEVARLRSVCEALEDSGLPLALVPRGDPS
jgi:hypothetical protein